MYDRILEAIEFENVSIHSLALAAGIGPSNLQRFVTGERGLQSDNLSKLFDQLGLELVRRLDVDEYLKEAWPEAWLLIQESCQPEYDEPKADAWKDHVKDAWKEVSSDENDYDQWAADEYTDWSRDYDADNFDEWKSEEYEKWADAERERIEAADWINLQ